MSPVANTAPPRELTYRPSRVAVLAQELVAGDLLYIEPPDTNTPQTKRVKAERLGELLTLLGARTLKLEPQGAGYWLAVRYVKPAGAPLTRCACCGYTRIQFGKCQRCLTAQTPMGAL